MSDIKWYVYNGKGKAHAMGRWGDMLCSICGMVSCHPQFARDVTSTVKDDRRCKTCMKSIHKWQTGEMDFRD